MNHWQTIEEQALLLRAPSGTAVTWKLSHRHREQYFAVRTLLLEDIENNLNRLYILDMQRHTGTNHGTAGDQHRRNRLFWGVLIVLLGLQGVFLAAYVSLAVKSVGDNTQQIVVEAARWNLACWAIGKNCHYRNDSALSWPSGGKDEPVTNLTQVAKALQDQAESSDTLIGHIQDVAGVASITRVRNQAYDLMTLAAGIGAGTEIPNHENVSQQLRGIGLDVESLSSNLGQMNAMTYDALRSFSRDVRLHSYLDCHAPSLTPIFSTSTPMS